jgi:hypothetical protein
MRAIFITSNNWMSIICKVCGSYQLCPNSRNYPWIFLKVLRRATEHLYRYGRCAVRGTVRSEVTSCVTTLSVSDRSAYVQEKNDGCSFWAKEIIYLPSRIRHNVLINTNININIYTYLHKYLHIYKHIYLHDTRLSSTSWVRQKSERQCKCLFLTTD